jgi:hypothetical protein
MAYIRKIKTASGAIAVQIANKAYGRIVRIDHIGSAHNEAELETLLALARQRLKGSQLDLFDETNSFQKDYSQTIGFTLTVANLKSAM